MQYRGVENKRDRLATHPNACLSAAICAMPVSVVVASSLASETLRSANLLVSLANKALARAARWVCAAEMVVGAVLGGAIIPLKSRRGPGKETGEASAVMLVMVFVSTTPSFGGLVSSVLGTPGDRSIIVDNYQECNGCWNDEAYNGCLILV